MISNVVHVRLMLAVVVNLLDIITVNVPPHSHECTDQALYLMSMHLCMQIVCMEQLVCVFYLELKESVVCLQYTGDRFLSRHVATLASFTFIASFG